MAIVHHIERIRSKPHHVRERIAFGIAAAITAFVSVIWFGTLAATGQLSLAPTTSSDDGANAAAQQAITQSQSNFSQLLGASGAAVGATSTPTGLHIVDNGSHSSLEQKQSQVTANNSDTTVIPF